MKQMLAIVYSFVRASMITWELNIVGIETVSMRDRGVYHKVLVARSILDAGVKLADEFELPGLIW